MTWLRPHHPAANRGYEIRNKVFHKESISHTKTLCKTESKKNPYKLADTDDQVTCKRCLKKMEKYEREK